MMVLEQLWRAVPGLESAIRQQPLAADREAAWVMLRSLLQAFAPSTGTTLPNGILDQVSDIAAAFGLADRLEADLGGVGNAGLWLGVAGGRVDLLVVAHLDRQTFRIERVEEDGQSARLVPVCTTMPCAEAVSAPGRALRLQDGRLEVGARGHLRADRQGVSFQAEEGLLLPSDLVTPDGNPRRQGDRVSGGGLDNAAGVLSVLGAAAALRRVEETLLEYDRRCLFVFPDRQDYSLTALMAMCPALRPTLGTIIVDVVGTVGTGVRPGAGAVCVLAGSQADGLVVPLNYQQLAQPLAEALNDIRPGSVQLWRACPEEWLGAVSRSLRERVLGYIGPAISKTRPGDETVHLPDIQAVAWWLACYIAAVLNLAPEVTRQYALGR
ncbi:MAG: hypothetical protein HPY64_12685 [Anaerolineae bacterium]|nr:hypothetical protein [Anaerolineae bacterium]